MPVHSLIDKYTDKLSQVPKQVIKNTLIVSGSLLYSQGVNLNKAKDFVPLVTGKRTNQASGDYKRLIRYFDQGTINNEEDRANYKILMNYLRTLCWLVLFHQKSGKRRFSEKQIKYLLLDGTKWDFGCHSIHLLTLCIVLDEVAIPIWWEDLEKAGHSSQAERIAYLKAAMVCYDFANMTLIADREYIGYEWFKWLDEQNIRFIVRLKEGIYHDEINGEKGLSWVQLKAKAEKKKAGQKVCKRIKFQDLELFYIILKNPRPDAEDEFIYLLTSWKSPTQAARIYEIRWQIEVCFKHLKSNGLRLEQMSVRGKEKRHLMMAVAVFIYILAIREGIIEESSLNHRVAYKKDKWTGFEYRAKSIFRKGLSALMRKFRLWSDLLVYIRRIIDAKYYCLIENV